MRETVSLDFELASPIARVWHALTDAAVLSRWTFFDTDDFRAVVGHRFHFRGKESTGWTQVIECEVLDVDEPRRISYTWVTAAWGANGDEGKHETVVTWTLRPAADGGTHLHLEQSGFDASATREIGGARYGWTAQLAELQRLLAAA